MNKLLRILDKTVKTLLPQSRNPLVVLLLNPCQHVRRQSLKIELQGVGTELKKVLVHIRYLYDFVFRFLAEITRKPILCTKC